MNKPADMEWPGTSFEFGFRVVGFTEVGHDRSKMAALHSFRRTFVVILENSKKNEFFTIFVLILSVVSVGQYVRL